MTYTWLNDRSRIAGERVDSLFEPFASAHNVAPVAAATTGARIARAAVGPKIHHRIWPIAVILDRRSATRCFPASLAGRSIMGADACIVANAAGRYLVLPAACRRRADMNLRNLQCRQSTDACTAFAAVALLMLGVAGCASDLTSTPSRAPADLAPYEGVFTGEFVDGKPLYRFPTIEVVGSRSSIEPGN
jgi:hypothetical protein